MKVFVGNLAEETAERDLATMFESFGSVDLVNIARESSTGQSRGFGFIDMEDGLAKAAVVGLNGSTLHGNTLRVSIARRHESAA